MFVFAEAICLNKQKGSGMLSLTFIDDTVTYRGETRPTGSVACMAMNISKETVDAALPLCQRIAPVNTMLRTGVADKAAMNSARLAAHVLLRLIAQHEPFTFFTHPELERRLDQVFTMDAFKKIHAYQSTVLAGTLDDAAQEKFGPTIDLMMLTPVLANFSDAITLLQEHIVPFAEKLDKGNLPRTQEAYLAEFSESFPEDVHMGDGSDSWLSMTNVSVQYTAGTSRNRPQMKKHMHFISFGGMLRADFFEGLSVGHAPKRCAICGRWFLTTDARHTKYCSEICPTDEQGRKCRVIGNLRGRAARELAADHPLNEPYDRRMNTIDQCLKRGTLSPELAAEMKKLAKDKKQRAKADMAYANSTYRMEMEQDALKVEALKLLK
jgi:hypothetical protein